jgi:hypothetical protein
VIVFKSVVIAVLNFVQYWLRAIGFTNTFNNAAAPHPNPLPQGEGAAPSAWLARAASESGVQKEDVWVIIEIDLFP